MSYKMYCLLACAIILAGCSKSSKTDQPQAGNQPQFPSDLPSMGGSPEDILVDVDGATLTRKDADTEVENRIAMISNQMPPEQLSQNLPRIKQSMMENVIRQFVDRTLILNEADRIKLQVSDADVSNAYRKIEASLPKGVTLDDAMSQRPLGRDEIKKEIDLSVRINKFFETSLSNEWNVTEQEIDDFMKDNKDNLTIPETVEARHILVQFDQADDEKAKEDKKKKLEDIREQLVKGADFAQMASEHSDCPSSQNGGNLGKFPRGQMTPVFEDAAFA